MYCMSLLFGHNEDRLLPGWIIVMVTETTPVSGTLLLPTEALLQCLFTPVAVSLGEVGPCIYKCDIHIHMFIHTPIVG